MRRSISLKSDYNASGAMGSRPDIAGTLAAVAKIASIDECLHGASVEQKLMLLVPASDGSGRVPGGLGRSKFDQIAGFQDYDVKGWTLDSAPYLRARWPGSWIC